MDCIIGPLMAVKKPLMTKIVHRRKPTGVYHVTNIDMAPMSVVTMRKPLNFPSLSQNAGPTMQPKKLPTVTIAAMKPAVATSMPLPS